MDHNIHNVKMLPIQKSLIFHSLDKPSNEASYIVQLKFTVNEFIDVDAMFIAVEKVVLHYDIFKAFLSSTDPFTLNLTNELQIKPIFKSIDISHLSEEGKADYLDKLLTEDLSKSFNLNLPPLVRVHIVKKTMTSYLILISYHHLLLGGDSVTFIQDVFGTYDCLRKNTQHQLSKAAPYDDVINAIYSSEPSNYSDYWKTLLQGYTGEIRHAISTKGIEHKKYFELSMIETEKLFDFCETNNIRVSYVLQCAWAITLCSLYKSNKQVFGVIKSYPKELLGNTVGPFFNTLPMIVDFNAHNTLVEVFNSLREQSKQNYVYYNTPTHKLRQWLSLPPNKVLFNAILDFKLTSVSDALVDTAMYSSGRKIDFTVRHDFPIVMELYFNCNRLCGYLSVHENVLVDNDVLAVIQVFLLSLSSVINNIERPINSIVDKSHLLDHVNCNENIPPTLNESTKCYLEVVSPKLLLEHKKIWLRLFNIDDNDTCANLDFFSLGGDSLLALHLVINIRKTFNVDVAINDVFCLRTFGALSHLIETKKQQVGNVEQNNITVCQSSYVRASFSQERLWLIDKLNDTSQSAYNICLKFDFKMPIPHYVMKRSLELIVSRHEVFRTLFSERDGMLYQEILPAEHFEIFIENVNLPIEEEIDFVNRLSGTPFKLTVDFPYRFFTIKNGDGVKALVFCVHHIIFDATSVNIFINELQTCCSCLLHSSTPSLPDVVINQKDFSNWQRETLHEQAKGQKEFWLNVLGNIKLPILRDNNSQVISDESESSYLRFSLDAGLVHELINELIDNGVTTNILLCSIFILTLYLFSGNDDLVVGMPITKRKYHEIEKAIGFFINTISLRVNLNICSTCEDFINHCMHIFGLSVANSDLPFDEVVRYVNPQRNNVDNPIFDCMFVYQDFTNSGCVKGENLFDWQFVSSGHAKLPFIFFVDKKQEGFFCNVEYNRNLFTNKFVQKFVSTYRNLLSFLVHNLSNPLSTLFANVYYADLNFISYDKYLSISDNFLGILNRQAEGLPDKVHVYYDSSSITYRKTKRHVINLVYQLEKRHIKKGSFVVVAIPRSLESYLLMLAVFEIGAIYVPVGYQAPQKYLEYILCETKAQLMISSLEQFKSQSSESTCLTLSDVQKWLSPKNSLEVYPLGMNTRGTDNAYLLYTSGTTGNPKGIMIKHGSLYNTISSIARFLSLTEAEHFLPIAPIEFDVSIGEHLLALYAGGTLTIPPKNIPRNVESLIKAIDKEITVLIATPSVWQMLLEFGWDNQRKICVVSTGEILPTQLANNILSVTDKIYNLYGPTETAIWSTAACLNLQSIDNSKTVSIGKPIDSTSVILLNQWKIPVPYGVVGEIYISGLGVSDGYFRNDQLTYENFVKLDAGNQVCYKTGDLAYLNHDGDLIYCGRRDGQIKLLGNRIETQSISMILNKEKNILGSHVFTYPINNLDQQLLALFCFDVSNEGAYYEFVTKQEESYLASWKDVWSAMYEQSYAGITQDERSSYWVSDITGQTISYKKMQAWLSNTVKLIRKHKPKNVLEIGCGKGDVLFSLIDCCELYHGVDLSLGALKYVEKNLSPTNKRKVQLSCGDLFSIKKTDQSYDIIILNSVVQYFPGIGYFERAIEHLADISNNKNVIFFIGDIRNYDLAESFYHEKAIFKHSDVIDNQLTHLLSDYYRLNENELLISPLYFMNLVNSQKVSSVSCLARSCEFSNELTKYRFDAIVYTGEIPVFVKNDKNKVANFAWQNESININAFVSSLSNQPHDIFLIRGISNNRCHNGVIDQLCHIEELLKHYGYKWNFYFDNDFYGEKVNIIASKQNEKIFHYNLANEKYIESIKMYANKPLMPQFIVSTIATLRNNISAILPSYACPAQYIPISFFPITERGKRDVSLLKQYIQCLKQPEGMNFQNIVDKRDTVIATLRSLWEICLGHQNFAQDCDFFKQGGSSFTVVRLKALIEDTFNVAVSLAELFSISRLSEQAALIDKKSAS